MARKKDLAGLAALGALGYALSRGKGDGVNVGESSDYTAGLDRNEDYGNEGNRPVRAPVRMPSAGGTAPAPTAPSRISVDDETGMSRGTRARDPRDMEAGMSRGTRSTSMAGAGRGSVNPSMPATAPDMSAYVPRRTPGPLTDVNRPGTRVRYENEDTYKKGGKTKASSASRRADGIATKGKTRGKMY